MSTNLLTPDIPRLRVRFGRAMQKQCADPCLVQAANGGIAVLRRRIVVTPVNQCGCPVVNLIECAHQVGDVDIL